MAGRHENRASGVEREKVVEITPPGPIRRQVYRLGFAAYYGFWIFAAISFAVGTVNFWMGEVIPWPISMAGQ